jgi:hypothetical protein
MPILVFELTLAPGPELIPFRFMLLSQALKDFLHLFSIVRVKVWRHAIFPELFIDSKSVADFIIIEAEFIFNVLSCFGHTLHVVLEKLATIH